jgi:hypothetical protein
MIAMDIQLSTTSHSRCGFHMGILNVTSLLMLPRERISVKNHHSITCPDLVSTSADSSPRNRELAKSLELDQFDV